MGGCAANVPPSILPENVYLGKEKAFLGKIVRKMLLFLFLMIVVMIPKDYGLILCRLPKPHVSSVKKGNYI